MIRCYDTFCNLPSLANTLPLWDYLELLFFLEEHTKADDGAIDEEAADNTHYHGGNRNDLRVC
jgi:hypothetical protein